MEFTKYQTTKEFEFMILNNEEDKKSKVFQNSLQSNDKILKILKGVLLSEKFWLNNSIKKTTNSRLDNSLVPWRKCETNQ